ncbi:hypothetical protein ALQ62_200169 [Pseudomonas coronafaciens pv. zizaniae]|nr:hypothetical protein ALO38_200037 [Pseudomonas coronafaciens pv. zizaniae]RMN24562.1 hypothetical protein ALQ62_200169 [Pseudomonas coronafaciens pv. zizaniae]
MSGERKLALAWGSLASVVRRPTCKLPVAKRYELSNASRELIKDLVSPE